MIKLQTNPVPKQPMFMTSKSFYELQDFIESTYGGDKQMLAAAYQVMNFTINTCHHVINELSEEVQKLAKAITMLEDSEKYASNWVAVGDTVNGKEIAEIWCSSIGTPILIIDGKHHAWNEFLEILPKAEVLEND